MTGLFPLIETAVAFSLVMLAASLVVSAFVQIIQSALRLRSRNLNQTLRGLFRGFRVYYNDPYLVGPNTTGQAPDEQEEWTGKAEGRQTIVPAATEPELEKRRLERQAIASKGEAAFAIDILTDPALHKLPTGTMTAAEQTKLLDRIEFIDKRDLVALAGSHAAFADPKVVGVPRSETETRKLKLPADWFHGPAKGPALPDAPGSNPARTVPPYATVGAFADYVARWFDTIEATHTQEFRNKLRLLTIAISGLAVMVMCLDGIQLARDLYHSREARESLDERAADIQRAASRLGVEGATPPEGEAPPGRDESRDDLLLEAQKVSTILDTTPGLSLGWQNAWITKRYCAYRGVCKDVPPPTGAAMAGDFVLFLAGLIFSSVMLSLGAPFWVKNLGRLINLRNEVANASTRRDDAETAAPKHARTVPVPAASAGPQITYEDEPPEKG